MSVRGRKVGTISNFSRNKHVDVIVSCVGTRVRLPPPPPETAISNGKCREIVPIKSRIFCLISRELRLLCFFTEIAWIGIFSVKIAVFSLKSLSLTLPRAVTIWPQTAPTFGRTQTTVSFEIRRVHYGLSKKFCAFFDRLYVMQSLTNGVHYIRMLPVWVYFSIDILCNFTGNLLHRPWKRLYLML